MRLWSIASILILVFSLTTAVGATPNESFVLRGYSGDDSYKDLVQWFVLSESEDSPLPDAWKGALPLKDYSGNHRPWFIDSSHPNGKDHLEFGLEGSTLAFFAGHGYKTEGFEVPNSLWDTWVPVRLVKVGDGDVRYFWLYSCNVLVHGPEEIAGSLRHSAPQCFRPKMGHADVFDNWTHAFGPNMRMVCGGSTSLGQKGVGAIWNYLLATQTSVADAWILGLTGPEEVPVCLARGPADPASSALSDRTLETEGLGSEKKWLHFQFPVECKLQPGTLPLHFICNRPSPCGTPAASPSSHRSLPEQEDLPTRVPLLLATDQENTLPFIAPSNVDQTRPLGFRQLIQEDALNVKDHPSAGSIVWIKSRNKPDQFHELKSCNAETEWTLQLPQSFRIKELRARASEAFELVRQGKGEVVALEMRVESRPDDKSKSPRCTARSLFVLIRRTISIGSKRYPIFGPAAAFEFQRRDNEAVADWVSFSTPRLNEPRFGEESVTLQPFKQAIREEHAAQQLDRGDYPLRYARATFGYEQAPLQCQQESLRPTYEIRFFPGRFAPAGHPIVTVRRDAREKPPAAWKCPSWGNFPAPQ